MELPTGQSAPRSELVGLKLQAEFRSLDDIDLDAFEDGIFHVDSNKPSLKCYFRRSSHPRLYVLLHGAVDRDKKPVPVLPRWNWSSILPGNMLCISDPTLELSPQLRWGAYLGTKNNDVSVACASLAERVALNLGLEKRDIVFFGSSGGGFSAIMCAQYVPESSALVMNALSQVTDSMLSKVATVFAPFMEEEKIRKVHGKRLSLLEAFASADNLPLTVFGQNTQDPKKYHYDKFCAKFGLPAEGGLSSNGRVLTTLFDAPGGHSHFPPRAVKNIIQKHIDFIAQRAAT